MSKITKSAKGEECQIRLWNHCNFNTETTVFCHIPGGGLGMKSDDIHGAYGCSNCHDVVDGRQKTFISDSDIKLFFYDAIIRTQLKLLEKGLIKI